MRACWWGMLPASLPARCHCFVPSNTFGCLTGCKSVSLRPLPHRLSPALPSDPLHLSACPHPTGTEAHRDMGHRSTQAAGTAIPAVGFEARDLSPCTGAGKRRAAWHGGLLRCCGPGRRGPGGLREGMGGSGPCYAVCSPHRGTAGCGFAGGCRRGFQLLPVQLGLGEDSTAGGGLGALRGKGTLACTHS